MEKYKFDVVAKTLTISAKFAEQMNCPESEEYALLLRLQKDFPGLKIVKKTHKTPTSYNNKNGTITKHNQYKNFTYERMEKFIASLPNSESYENEYNAVKDFATNNCANGYSMVRKWFDVQLLMQLLTNLEKIL